MKLIIPHVHRSGLLALFLFTNAIEEVSSLSTSNRDLQITKDGPITFIEPGKGAHVVRISQTFVGKSADGCDENENGSNARIMFATFMDPDTLQEKCGIFQRNVSPCFQETVVVGCDLEANAATINLYVVDESFEKGMTTDNPKMGRCKAGMGDIIQRAIKVTQTFDCLPLTEEEKSTLRFNTCSDSSDYCAEGAYCLFSSSDGYRCITGEPNPVCSCQEDEECFYSNLKKGYYCRPFAQLGDQCTGAEVSEISRTCNSKTSFCYLRDSCYNPSQTGVCVALSSDVQCSSNDDCEEIIDYCHFDFSSFFGRCRPKLKKGDCCSYYGCGDGLTCEHRTVHSSSKLSCHTVCNVKDGGSSCTENEWCKDKKRCYYEDDDDDDLIEVGFYDFCKSLGAKGDSCDDDFEFCVPETVCFIPNWNSNNEKRGICRTPCKDVSDCDFAEEWCDMTEGVCVPRLPEKFDCVPNIKKQCQEGLECREGSGGGWQCSPSSDTY